MANWLTVLLLFATLVFSVLLAWLNRKRMNLQFGKRPRYNGFWIMATNTSNTRRINIDKYGYKKWDGTTGHEDAWRPVVIGEQVQPRGQEDLPFYNREKGSDMDVNIGDVYYVYVKDTAGKVYRAYPYFKMRAWLKRFSIWFQQLFHRLHRGT